MGWQPQFIGVHEGNKAIYYFSNAFQQLDLNTGKIVKLTSIPNELEIKENIHLPDEILFKNKSSGKAASSGYKDYEAEQYHKIIFLKDGSYLKTFNNQLFSNGLEEWKRTYGSGASVVLFNKNHAFVKSIDFPHYNIKDCAVDEISGRFALSYKGADTTYLAYFNLETLRLQSIVFAKANKEYDDDKGQSGYLNQPGEIQFSRTGKYLILSRGYPNNNTVYKENDLYFGFEGHIYDFSEDDGVVLTNFYGSIIAFDLEKRAAFSKFEVHDEIFSTSFFNLKNNLYILSHNYSVSGNTYTINGIKLTHLMMPLPRGSSK